MDLELKSKRVLITGASQGIGAAIAARMLEEGADVCLVSRGSQKLFDLEQLLAEQYGQQRVSAMVCDCTDFEALQNLADIVKAQLGGIDVVIANVGDGRSTPEALPSHEQWQSTWKNNFESALYTARAFLDMLEDSRGNLLFISSICAKEAFGAPVDYGTAKTALLGLAKNMARKLGEQIRINVLAPGNVLFEGGSWEEKIKRDPERVKNIIDDSVPMKRFGTPEEIADSAVFLTSPRAAFITGTVLVVDGGQTVGVF